VRTYKTGFLKNKDIIAQYDWPADCFIQSGGDGLVLDGDKSYKTAFFEAFPKIIVNSKSQSAFIRGEGKSIDEAETQAWNHYTKILNCGNHIFERRGYETGAGICKNCNLFLSKVFEKTLKPCCVCGRDDNMASYGVDKDNNWYCEKDFRSMPEDKKSDMHKEMDKMRLED